jgi:hypothetical protein
MVFKIGFVNGIISYILVSAFTFIAYSQTLQLKTVDENKTVLIQQLGTEVVRVIPSSGNNYIPESQPGNSSASTRKQIHSIGN